MGMGGMSYDSALGTGNFTGSTGHIDGPEITKRELLTAKADKAKNVLAVANAAVDKIQTSAMSDKAKALKGRATHLATKVKNLKHYAKRGVVGFIDKISTFFKLQIAKIRLGSVQQDLHPYDSAKAEKAVKKAQEELTAVNNDIATLDAEELAAVAEDQAELQRQAANFRNFMKKEDDYIAAYILANPNASEDDIYEERALFMW